MSLAIVIDTNAYSAFKQGNKQALEIILKVDAIIMCPIVLGELYAGFRLGKQERRNLSELQSFLGDPKVLSLSINSQTAETYARIYQGLRQQGTPIPTNDMWVAALASQLGQPVFTYDVHFTRIKGLKVVRGPADLAD